MLTTITCSFGIDSANVGLGLHIVQRTQCKYNLLVAYTLKIINIQINCIFQLYNIELLIYHNNNTFGLPLRSNGMLISLFAMTITCKDVNPSSIHFEYEGAKNFVLAYPETNPTTPLGPNWKFEPCFLPLKYKNYKEAFENFEVFPDDVWSITFPKTGSTWTQEMLWMLGNDLDYSTAKSIHLMDRFPFIDFDIVYDYQSFGQLKIVEEMKSPRYIKCHLPAGLLPKQLWTKKPKIVYTARGVKDTAISLFHHYVNLQGYNGSKEQFLDAFLNDMVFYGPYQSHVKDFWFMRNESNILFLNYEDMKLDMKSVLKKTSSFLGKSYSEDDLGTLEKHLAFDSMKSNFSVNLEDKTSENFSFIRKGVVGSHSEEMSLDFIGKFDKWTNEYNANNGTAITL